MNSVALVGRLTKDPELRKTANGTSVCAFNLAVNRPYAKQGEQDADFISCVAWNLTAENLAKYQHKGSLIGLEGKIQTRNYDNQQGQRVYVTEVIANNIQFLESRNSQNQQQDYVPNEPVQQDPYDPQYDELPF